MIFLLDDARAAARSLARSPRFLILASTCLALGLGANAVMFGVVDTLFLRPPAGVREPARVVRFYFYRTLRGPGLVITDLLSFPIFHDIEKNTSAFERVAAYYRTTISEGRGASASKLNASLVTAGYFDLVGAIPERGRLLQPLDANPSAAPAAVISDDLWRARYGASPSVIGSMLLIASRAYSIVGVAPRGFVGVDLDRTDVWLPGEIAANDLIMPGYMASRGAWAITMVARLNPGVTERQGEADATRAFRTGMRGSPSFDSTDHIKFAPLLHELGPKPTDQATISRWLSGVAVAVLLIAGINAAGLMLVRTIQRRRDLALRSALGASRLRLIRVLALEALGLSVVAAGAATVIDIAGTRAFGTLLLPEKASLQAISFGRVFLFTVGLALALGLAAVMPAIRILWRQDLVDSLKDGPRSGARRSAGQAVMLMGQIGLTTVLLVGASLFLRSLMNLRTRDMGFDTAGVLAINLDFSGMMARTQSNGAAVEDQYRRLEEAVRAVPGIRATGVATSIPFQNISVSPITVPGRDSATPPRPPAYASVASSGYRKAIGLRLLAGRWFEASDYGAGGKNAVINETFARLYWPGESALGKCFTAGTPECRYVVGIVQDTRQRNVREEARAQLYLPDIPQREYSDRLPRTIIVRADHPAAVMAPLRRAIQTVEPAAPYITIQPLSALMEPKVRPWTLGASMFTLFGALALVLATVGLYGSISSAVTQRSHEIGVRIALGATSVQVTRTVLRQAIVVTATGTVLGAVIAFLAEPKVEGLLFEMHARQTMLFMAAIAAVVTASLLASLLPARRISRVNVLQVLTKI